MSRTDKLFRAIVVMGAAITLPACDSGKPPLPPPVPSGDTTAAPADASPAPKAPGDAIAAPADATDAPRDATAATDASKRADAGVDPATPVPFLAIL